MPRKKKTKVAQKKKASKKENKNTSTKYGSCPDLQDDVSNVFGSGSLNVPDSAPPDPNIAMMACLQQLEEFNRDLAKHMEQLEQQNSVNSIPLLSPNDRDPTLVRFHPGANSMPSSSQVRSSAQYLQGSIPRQDHAMSHHA